jgi:succinoglycan biosynthesis protein ExoA
VFMGVARRETWLRYPFNDGFVRNQDDELSYRVLDDGGRIVCDPAIESWYQSRSTLGSLWRQYFDYGCWKVRVLQVHPRQARVRHLVPLGLVTTLGGGAILGVTSRKARAGAKVALGLYAVATAAAATHYRDRSSPRSAVLLAATFPVLHFAYGTGMLRGVWRFRHSFGLPVGVTGLEVPGSRPGATSTALAPSAAGRGPGALATGTARSLEPPADASHGCANPEPAT